MCLHVPATHTLHLAMNLYYDFATGISGCWVTLQVLVSSGIWGYRSEVLLFSSMCKTVGSIPGTEKQTKITKQSNKNHHIYFIGSPQFLIASKTTVLIPADPAWPLKTPLWDLVPQTRLDFSWWEYIQSVLKKYRGSIWLRIPTGCLKLFRC